MKLREVVNCHGCLRATRDWETVALVRNGRTEREYQLCARCRSDVSDGVVRTVRELRGEAVQR